MIDLKFIIILFFIGFKDKFIQLVDNLLIFGFGFCKTLLGRTALCKLAPIAVEILFVQRGHCRAEQKGCNGKRDEFFHETLMFRFKKINPETSGLTPFLVDKLVF